MKHTHTKYFRNHHSSATGFCAALALIAAVAAPVASATVIATDFSIPTNMDAGGQPNDYAEYIMGENGAINIQSTSTVNIGVSNSRNSLLVHNGTGWRALGSVRLGVNESSMHNRLTVSGVDTAIAGGNLYVGVLGHNNAMLVKEGAAVELSSDLRVGEGDGWDHSLASNNSLEINGEGSRVQVNSSFNAYIGNYGNNNRMNVVNGGSFVSTSSLIVGGGVYYTLGQGVAEQENSRKMGNYNELTVAGAGSILSVRHNVIGGYGDHNKMRIADGALVATSGLFVVGGVDTEAGKAMNNEALVTGRESVLAIEENLLIGNYGSGNTLTVADGALVGVNGDIIISNRDGAEDNYLRINDGFVAWQGDQREATNDLLAEGKILTWNIALQIWENALSSDHFEMYYFATDAEAFAYTGHDGLAGYTVWGTGAIPEPGVYAAFVAVAGALLALRRRRRA